MSESRVIYCSACGASLNVELNRPFVFCQYCGCKNIIESQTMKANINVGGMNIQANTELESMLASAEYAISIGQYDKANDMLLASIMSGCNDYRVYILKAKIDLMLDNNKSFFATMDRLRFLESRQSPDREVTRAICELMHYRGKNGVVALHIATYHEQFNWVVYFTEHGCDVNCVAGMRSVTPISIMFVPVNSSQSGLDGTPFMRHKPMVVQIRNYLMAHGARDVRRRGY